MADYDTNIRIGLEADLAGGMQTEKQLDRLKAKAVDLGKANAAAADKGRSAMDAFRGSLGKVTGVFGAVSAAAAGFVSIYKTLKAEAEATRTAIEKTKADALAHSLELAAKDFADLKKNAADFAQAMADAEKVQQGMLANSRGLRDAQLKLAEAKEIAALGQGDPDRDLKIQRIQQKYGTMRGENAASDQLENITLKRQGNSQQIANNAAQISELEAQAAGLADDEFSLRRRAQQSAAAANNILTKKNWMGMAGRNWAGVANDKEAQAAADKSLELSAAADAVKKDREEIEEHIRQLKRTNSALEAENNALYDQRKVVETNRAAAAVEEGTAVAVTAEAQAVRNEKRAAQAAKIAGLESSIQSGTSTAAGLRSQIAFHESRYAQAEDAQARAGFALSTVDKKDGGALKSAQNAKYQADRTVAEITGVLSELTAKLKAVEDGLKRDRSRLATAKEETSS